MEEVMTETESILTLARTPSSGPCGQNAASYQGGFWDFRL